MSHIYNQNKQIMGRKKIKTDLKKTKLSITISSENNDKLETLAFTNKSKLINHLLKEYFGLIQEGGSYEK